MRAGTLRERITLQVPTTVTDPTWGETEGSPNTATVAASVVVTGAGEKSKDGGVQSETTYTIRCRYLNGVDSTCRVIWRGKELAIVSAVDPESRRRELVIVAKEYPQRT